MNDSLAQVKLNGVMVGVGLNHRVPVEKRRKCREIGPFLAPDIANEEFIASDQSDFIQNARSPLPGQGKDRSFASDFLAQRDFPRESKRRPLSPRVVKVYRGG